MREGNYVSTMKIRAALAMLLAVLCAAAGAAEQDVMRVYVSEEALGESDAEQAIRMLAAQWPDTTWEQVTGGEDLRTWVMKDRAPQLAICSPAEAREWAAEGLLLPLQTRIEGQTRIQSQVLDACVMEEQLFMAPLRAKHRQMAVNTDLFEQAHLSHMLDRAEYPAWYPAQMQQMIEELTFSDMTAFEIWLPDEENSAALEALVQAIYAGSFAAEDETRWQMDSEEIHAGMNWLNDLLECEMIAMAKSREDALARFVRGETAMFIDWSVDTAAQQKDALAKNGIEVAAVPYPSAAGVPVRSYELVGICAFDSGDTARNALALQAAQRLYQQAEKWLGSRGIARDDSIWMTCLSAHEQGATVRSLFAKALAGVLSGEATARDALEQAQAALDAMP